MREGGLNDKKHHLLSAILGHWHSTHKDRQSTAPCCPLFSFEDTTFASYVPDIIFLTRCFDISWAAKLKVDEKGRART